MDLLKNEKGISGIDVGIAAIVIILFISIITTLFYQVYLATTETKRKAEATVYISRILENIQSLNYEYITEEEGKRDDIINTLKKLGGDSSEPTFNNNQYEITIGGYNITLNIENYTKEDVEVEDVIKKIIVTAKYSVNKQEQTLDISTIVTKEK